MRDDDEAQKRKENFFNFEMWHEWVSEREREKFLLCHTFLSSTTKYLVKLFHPPTPPPSRSYAKKIQKRLEYIYMLIYCQFKYLRRTAQTWKW